MMSRPTPDPTRWLTDLMSTQQVPWPNLDITGTSQAMYAAMAPWTKAVSDITALQMEALKQLTAPWAALIPGAGAGAEPIKDRRFTGEAWTKDPRFEAVARTYLAQTDLLRQALDAAPLDERSKGQWAFALNQVMDALSPANTLVTNPEALQLAMETGGASLLEGMRLFTEDLARGRIAMTDETAFEVGRNVGTTPGAVVFQNDVMQLIQYTPTTDRVYKRPLVIIPPCINKYYILDLQPENSFVAHAVAEGHTVFLASWFNSGPEQGGQTWDDYVEQGALKALDVAREITGADKVNTLGFCIGGTVLATALAVRAARGEHPAASMTLMTTLLDFGEGGDLGLLITPEMVAKREATIGKGGLLKGSEMAQVFASLRANDLIWPYVVKGYLKGQAPKAFDLLYWNSDTTNLPGPMFCWYLRNCYLENKLREPGAVTVAGQPVDFRSIEAPTFLYASKDDHIVPWTSAHKSTQLLSGEVTFVLGASGHIAGVINPPAKNKRNYWVATGVGAADDAAPGAKQEADPERWLETAEKVPGSWWPNWYAWLAPHGGAQVVAPKRPGNVQYRPVEEAPGSYVRAKAS
jgi:poly[(R)-3-hydroxyalkanoate] polymerase subunit PhaC